MEVVPTSNMKPKLLRLLVLSAAVAAYTFAAEPFRPFVLSLAPGSSAAAAQKALGAPSAKLGPNLWVYFDFAKPNPNAANPAFDTLVVAFHDGRVSDVKITDGRVVRVLLAQYAAQRAKAPVAAK